MAASPALVQAMRVMHCCYSSDDAATTVAFLEQAVGLEARATMRGIRADGTPLGIARTVESDMSLVYDPRGGRVSPAVEVYGWIDPPAVGVPYADATRVGIQAVGVAVPRLDPALERLGAHGATVTGALHDERLPLGGPTGFVHAPDGVALDVVARDDLEHVQLAHLRVTCSDLHRSVEWYGALGWSVVEGPREEVLDGRALGVGATAAAVVARLRLADEPLGLVLVEWREPPSHGESYASANHRGLSRFALGVEDARVATQALVDAGWVPTARPSLVEMPGTKIPALWVTFLCDPDGIVVELVERAREAFAQSLELT